MVIPATAIIVTRNEGENIAYALLPLIGLFNRVLVLDSNSTDDTAATAKSMGADVVNFTWNGTYPKKRQWCLDNISGLDDWVFFIDADEVATPQLLREIRLLFARGVKADGYFIRGKYIWMNQKLRFGMYNNKLCLFRRSKFKFPVVDDLDIAGMGEIEGHYQPVPITDDATIGQLVNPVIHYNRKGRGDWLQRHARYAGWEAGMIKRDAFPIDPIWWRQDLKSLTRGLFLRPYLVFLHSYILKLGILDGVAGLDFALHRAAYARDVLKRLRIAQ
jgi:glycosyltransferase involved in cell wall biosynthesis